METVLAIVCPGQGSQTPGLLSPWLQAEGAAELIDEFSDAAGTDLRVHGTSSDEETIRDTAVAQPLIVAASLLSAQALGLSPERVASFGPKALVAGHSVGEIPAAALAGVITRAQAGRLIGVRASAMAEAAAAEATGMAAVLGGKEEDVQAAIEAAGLAAANVNAPGQVVAAGSEQALQQLAENPPARARIVPLKVAGAFHTDYMAEARTALEQEAAQVQPADPGTGLLSNRDGVRVSSGAEALSRIVDQVTRPVRWDKCMETMRETGVTGILELLPGGTLVGLAKRGLRGVESFAVTSPEDVERAAEFIDEHTR